MIKIPKDRYGNEGWAVRARKAFRCADCRREVQPGECYYRAVAWPRTDINEGSVPWVLRLCVGCLHEDHRARFDAIVDARITVVSQEGSTHER